MLITIAQLKAIMPQARTQLAEQFLDVFNQQLPQYQVDQPLRLAAFLAQGAYESGELRALVENMYYTTPERLMQVWPTRFPTIDSATPYLKDPAKLGNHVYAGRLGNGDEASGDGYRYRGRGWFNGTGKDFYKRMSTLTGHDFVASPDDMAEPAFAVLSACDEWKAWNLNAYADKSDFRSITKKINGALTGLDARIIYYHRARIAFNIGA